MGQVLFENAALLDVERGERRPGTSVLVDGSGQLTSPLGVVSFPGSTATVATGLTGPFVDVANAMGEVAGASLGVSAGGAAVWSAADIETIDAQLSAFVHAAIVKDFVRGVAPDLAWLDQQIPVTVNIDDECNAFSDGNSINFFRTSPACENTGRLADVGQGLGYLTGRSVSMRQDLDRLNTFIDTNAVASTRLQQSQTTFEGIADLAQEFISTLVGARASAASADVAVADARTKLIALTASMNNAANGAFLYSGINTDVKPLTDYFATPTSANRAAVATAFNTQFGVNQGDPGTELITGTDMKTFLDGPFSAMFDPANWSGTWWSSCASRAPGPTACPSCTS